MRATHMQFNTDQFETLQARLSCFVNMQAVFALSSIYFLRHFGALILLKCITVGVL